jgi:predicted SAM-dependent methyltransferase
MRKLTTQLHRKVYLYSLVKKLLQNLVAIKEYILWQFKRRFGRIDNRIIKSYLSEQKIRKLHIGCGENILFSWLNADYFPHSDNILHCDATSKFRFEDEVFDYVFSEHVIEHLSCLDGYAMLSECYRVLKDKGKIRISTPDLQFLIDLYRNDKSELEKEYVRWATDCFIKNAPYYDCTFVINNFVRDWGHVFIYDEKTLSSLLRCVGFTEITRCDLNESRVEALANLEHEKRMPKGFLKLETFTLEATKS